MLILGLGTNLGDSLNNLRLAIQRLRQSQTVIPIQVSPVYASSALLPCDTPVAWNRPYLNIAVTCKTHLAPIDVLSSIKELEKQLGREKGPRWAPRPIDIDILAWDDSVIDQVGLQVPHAELPHRPFALWPLLDLLPEWKHPKLALSDLLASWGSRFSGLAPFNTRQIPHRIEGSVLVGILNVTLDSFSDGGQFITLPSALAQAEKLFFEGAEVLDIGAESTRPGARPVLPEDEWALLAPVLTALKAQYKQSSFKPKLSVDTRHVAVAEKAIDLGVDWINDVSGFENIKMRELVAKSTVHGVVMHHLGIPANKAVVLSDDTHICTQILDWTERRLGELLSVGVDPKRLIFDIGIGFGKTAEQSAFLLQHIKSFQRLNCPLLVGHSRKSFLNLITHKPYADRDFETAVLSYQLATQGVDYLRVHNVALNARAVAMAETFSSSTPSKI